MGAKELSYLSDYGPRLIDQGYNVVPIKAGFKFPKGLKNWETITASHDDIAKWAKRFEGAGVLCAHNPAVDLDIRDPEISQMMVNYVESLLGKTVQRIGQAPKTLLVFRTNEPFGKITSKLYEDLMGVEHRVEILGDGQQFVAFATHPDTNEPYTWPGKNLSEINSNDLPLLTREDAERIVRYFEANVPVHWGEKERGQTQTSIPVDDVSVLEHIKPKIDITLNQLKNHLRKINADEYSTWVRVGMALFHQFDGGDLGFKLWDAWSKMSDKYDSKAVRLKWKSFESDLRKSPVTAATIVQLAKENTILVSANDQQAFTLVKGSDILAKLAPPEWLIHGIVEKDSTGLIFGDPANYKSFLTIDLACHVAAGKEWHGHPVKQGPVIYVAGEGHNGFARRLAAWEMGNEGYSIADMPIYFSLKAAGLYDAEQALQVTTAIDQIVDQEGAQPALIVIDTLARNFGAGDENSTSDMNVFVNHVNDFLRVKYGCVVMIVHHTGKADKNNARGSSALKGAVDFEYRIDRPDEENGETLVCQMVNTKMKDAPEPAPIWFQGEEKIIGDFDEDVTSLVFKKTNAPDKTPADQKLKGQQSALFNFIKKVTETDGFIERSDLRKAAVDSGISRDSKQFHNTVKELDKKKLICTKDNEISVLDEFL